MYRGHGGITVLHDQTTMIQLIFDLSGLYELQTYKQMLTEATAASRPCSVPFSTNFSLSSLAAAAAVAAAAAAAAAAAVTLLLLVALLLPLLCHRH